jgi:hypothetical protein
VPPSHRTAFGNPAFGPSYFLRTSALCFKACWMPRQPARLARMSILPTSQGDRPRRMTKVAQRAVTAAHGRANTDSRGLLQV